MQNHARDHDNNRHLSLYCERVYLFGNRPQQVALACLTWLRMFYARGDVPF